MTEPQPLTQDERSERKQHARHLREDCDTLIIAANICKREGHYAASDAVRRAVRDLMAFSRQLDEEASRDD